MPVTSSSLVHLPNAPYVQSEDARAIIQWMEPIFRMLFQRINEIDELQFHVSYKAPPKPRIGQMVYADGIQWNPGHGEGLYVWKSIAPPGPTPGWDFIA